MVKRSNRGKKTKKGYSKKRNKRYKKKYSKKRYTKKNILKGGLLTPRQLELLRKVNPELGGRTNYCRKKNKFKNRTEQDCDDKEPVCEFSPLENRCLKSKENILRLNNNLNSNYYPPFTRVFYKDKDAVVEEETNVRTLRHLVARSRDFLSKLVRIEGTEEWKPLRETKLDRLLETYVKHLEGVEKIVIPVEESIIEEWTEKRKQYEIDNNCQQIELHGHSNYPTEECIYFNPKTNIDIAYEILRREAKPESNIYLHLDSAHGELVSRRTHLNSNLHLILNPARGHVEWISSREISNVTATMKMLSIMKNYIDNAGPNFEDLFTSEGCMTLNGSLLFYSIALSHLFNSEKMENIMGQIHKERNKNDGIKLSEVLRKINENIQFFGYTPRWCFKEMLFRILKLYIPGDTINDTSFDVMREETDRENGRIKGSKSGYSHAKWGLTILYTNQSDENKYFHLPLIEIETGLEGEIFLSQIIEYLEPFESLNHKFFMKHSSCRVDEEHGQKKEYNPDFSYLTREISTPKEEAHKNCFINYFEEPQKSDVMGFLSAYPTMIDYYLWLKVGEQIMNYINILMDHGEGSVELYEFIRDNH